MHNQITLSFMDAIGVTLLKQGKKEQARCRFEMVCVASLHTNKHTPNFQPLSS